MTRKSPQAALLKGERSSAKAKTPLTTDTWAELYDLESHRVPVKHRTRPGRPARPVRRTRVTLELTDEELEALIQIQSAIGARLSKGGRLSSVSRGQVAGLGLRLLKTYLAGSSASSALGEIRLPEHITDWKGIAELLHSSPKG
jgi:hypothetical protein